MAAISEIKVEWDAAVINRLLEEDASQGLPLLSQLLYWQEEEQASIYVDREAFLALIDKVFFKFIGHDTAVAALDGFLQKWENSTEPNILVPKNLVSKQSLENACKERAQEGPQEQSTATKVVYATAVVVTLLGSSYESGGFKVGAIEAKDVRIGPFGIESVKIGSVEVGSKSVSIKGVLDRFLTQTSSSSK